MTKPNYRLRLEIYDSETDAVIAQETTPLVAAMYEEPQRMFARVFSYFNNQGKKQHEETHHPDFLKPFPSSLSES